ncbi:molecular chaperone DjiA [Paracoccus sp. (in: a-proteobacteria)]|uniref:molecular chaperone DjiA n=1 Tax=Paracoccus sp. TaxID=267 RepID=UPI0026E0E38C|nr:molecular chaperone DjiA [Paracoccus sp. (in: a-proteobacteria)]MDO5371171.1 molecular chaperone DjiA [Paracoccus sp. (in: a-proteobacteria)]
MDDFAITTAQAPPHLPPPRGFWQRIGDRLAALIGRNRAVVPPERSVAFTIGVIALGAKIAKADGRVAREEVAAFRRIFKIPRSEERHAAHVFDLARKDVAGFDLWAERLARLFPPGDPVLVDVLDGLYVIATSTEHELHEGEQVFLDEVARIFGISPEDHAAIRASRLPGQPRCLPCEVLGISPGTPLPEARARYRDLIRENHPDRAQAHGLPPEAIRLAESRTRAINEAWAAWRAQFG